MKRRLLTGTHALAGGVGFLTRVPIGRGDAAWNAFRRTPWSWPIVAIPIGAAVASVFVLPVPALALAVLAAGWLYLLTGITHLDGLADLGDVAAMHGTREQRREVLDDPRIGVGGTAAIVFVILWLIAMLHTAVTMLPLATAVLLVITAEVGAKLAMATGACVFDSAHRGMGASVLEPNGPRDLLGPVAVSLPIVGIGWPHPAPALAIITGPVAALWIGWWATARIGGVSGDVLGATNEIGRGVCLGVGVIGWLIL